MSNCITSLENCQSEVNETFSSRKKKSVYIGSLFDELGLFKRAEKVRSCGSFLEFRVSSENAKLYWANFCKDRLCPMCNWRRSLKIFSRVSRIMNELEKEGFRFLFLTLTVKSCDNEHLKETIDDQLKAYAKLLRRKKVVSCVYGSYRAMEITYSDRWGWHPHIHVILAVKEEYFDTSKDLYIKQPIWRELWQKCCSTDYLPFVNIKAVKKGKLDLTDDVDVNTISFKSAVKEVAKYITKESGRKGYLKYDGNDKYRLKALNDATYRHKLNNLTGVFLDVAHRLAYDDIDNTDLIHTDDDIRSDVYEMIVRYRWKSGVYVREIWDYDEQIKENSFYQ